MSLAVSVWLDPFGWTATDWTALQVVVLLVAAVVAVRQVGEARKLREATIRPFVVVDFLHRGTIIELTISNIGKTMASDVTFDFDPPIKTTYDAAAGHEPLAEAPMFKNKIPSLAPGKEMTIVFDRSPDRLKAELPLTYNVTARYRSEPLNKDYADPIVLDLTPLLGVTPVVRKDIHDIHQRLDEISKEVRKWTVLGDALHVMRPDDVRGHWDAFDRSGDE